MKDEDYNRPNDRSTEMNTSSSIINKLVKEGYVESFKATKEGLYAPSKDKCYPPDEVSVTNFYRFEGESDPADNTILYSIETTDGVKGIIMDAFGPLADEYVTNFIKQVDEINKKE